MKTKITLTMAGILILVFTFSAFAVQEKTDEKSEQEFRKIFFWAQKDLFDARILLKVKDEIDLTRDQERKAENMMLAYEESTIKNSAEIKVLELKFASYIESQKVDRKEIEKLIKKISKRKTECIIKYMNYLLDLQETLSPQQKEKLKEIHRKFKRKIEKQEEEKRDCRPHGF